MKNTRLKKVNWKVNGIASYSCSVVTYVYLLDFRMHDICRIPCHWILYNCNSSLSKYANKSCLSIIDDMEQTHLERNIQTIKKREHRMWFFMLQILFQTDLLQDSWTVYSVLPLHTFRLCTLFQGYKNFLKESSSKQDYRWWRNDSAEVVGLSRAGSCSLQVLQVTWLSALGFPWGKLRDTNRDFLLLLLTWLQQALALFLRVGIGT